MIDEKSRDRMLGTIDDIEILDDQGSPVDFSGMDTIHRVITTARSGLVSKMSFEDRSSAVEVFEQFKKQVDDGTIIEVSFVGKDERGKPVELKHSA